MGRNSWRHVYEHKRGVAVIMIIPSIWNFEGEWKKRRVCDKDHDAALQRVVRAPTDDFTLGKRINVIPRALARSYRFKPLRAPPPLDEFGTMAVLVPDFGREHSSLSQFLG
ncbi:uncharacterized protein PADG_12420 [Paracoccidioides brasiliensis Pb18]|uniref:Uncharacterized protein n=1 Tax=Paracoccidioides brasiliensis (strain Pb18) TaxID=502780 RepID=A0A0A0HT50_PARBD|nr:uncharacterized protein PADG_12420 [Paracoccidioides brasiliensis Pb18]KGM91488.1 hypothetical protein PADG_12420 [Paracoccidioides brasiliensis Pb18]